MKFLKGSFPIQNIPAMRERIWVVSGWVDSTNTYGFYKYGKVWKATDLVSGTLVVTQPTRKACAEWIETHGSNIAEKKETYDYRLKVESFRIELKEVLNEAEQVG